jgi:hypothetical protein
VWCSPCCVFANLAAADNRDEDEDVKMGDETGASSSEYEVLIRCTQDNKSKFSARVSVSPAYNLYNLEFGSAAFLSSSTVFHATRTNLADEHR